MNLELSSLRLLVSATLAVSITGACGTIHNIGDNPDGTGGSSPAATGGTGLGEANGSGGTGAGGLVSTGGAGGIGGAMQTGGAQNGTGGTACNIPCAAASADIYLDVTASDGSVISGVQVTFSGPATGTMSCETHDGVATDCRWPSYVPATEGSYSLLVTAPGFQAVNVAATVAISSGPCCKDGTLDPSTVTLDTCTGTDCSVPVTCVHNGQTYDVGSFYSEGCTSCMCLSDGTWGHCTGACPDPLVQACLDAGGTAGSALCCASSADFPNMCVAGPCSCSPENSKTVSVCQCPNGTCFDGTACVTSTY